MATLGEHTRNRTRAARVRSAIDKYICAIRPLSQSARYLTNPDQLAAIAAEDLDETLAAVLDEIADEIREEGRP